MAHYKWLERYSVGVPEIDDQHKELFALMNQAVDAVENRNCAEAVGVLLPKLVDYADDHFSIEEKKMADIHYENQDIHKAQHDAFRMRLDEMAARTKRSDESERAASMLDLVNLVHNWLVNHIGTVDQELVVHLKR